MVRGNEVGWTNCRNKVVSLLGLALVTPLFAQGEPVEGRVEKPSPGVWSDKIYRWYYNPQNHPSWLDAKAARELVLDASRKWEVCGVRMDYQGETELAAGRMDGNNVVGWSLEMPRKLRGITLGKVKAGHLLERDIAFLPDRREFERFPRLLQKVITHEFGHAIGLTHSPRCDDVMTLAADCPRIDPDHLPLELTGHDLARCRIIYPDLPQ